MRVLLTLGSHDCGGDRVWCEQLKVKEREMDQKTLTVRRRSAKVMQRGDSTNAGERRSPLFENVCFVE